MVRDSLDQSTTLRHQYNRYMTLARYRLMANPSIQHAVQYGCDWQQSRAIYYTLAPISSIYDLGQD
jgi:hypothetical protein